MKSCPTGYDKLYNKMSEIIDILYGHDRTVLGFTPLVSCKFESRSWRGARDATLCDKSNLRHVGGFLRVLRFPPPIKMTATI
jgi:hypothetical protein